jgi:hypothetical protein
MNHLGCYFGVWINTDRLFLVRFTVPMPLLREILLSLLAHDSPPAPHYLAVRVHDTLEPPERASPLPF